MSRSNADEVSAFIAKQVAKHHRGQEENLAEAIAEIQIQTQISGASFIEVHCVDPEWAIQTSGLITVEEGLLNEVEVEFPEGSDLMWRLCAAEGGTEPSQPNLMLKFEDAIVNLLREKRGEKTFKGTRAQAIKAMVDEVGFSGKHEKIKFVCPSLHAPEKLQSTQTNSAGKPETRTVASLQVAEQRANKPPGPVTRASWAESLLETLGVPVSPSNVQAVVAWETAEGGAGPQFGVSGNSANFNPLNTTQAEPGSRAIGGNASGVQTYETWAQGLEATVKTLRNGNYGGILTALKEAKSAKAVAEAVGKSVWGTQQGGIEAALHASGGEGGVRITGVGTREEKRSTAGGLKRGSTQHPSEDSWECMGRFAKEVNWFLFTDGEKLFYMDGPELVNQHPALILDVPKNHVEFTSTTGRKFSQYGLIQQGLIWTVDNTTVEYQKTHKIKGRVVKRSKISKPQTPAEIRLKLLCEPTQFRAGEVFLFVNSGPIDGRWIVTDATRNFLKDKFTQFILEPPQAPTPAKAEAAAAATTSSGTAQGAAAQAEKALSEKGKYQYSEASNRGNNGTLFGPAPRTMDCSAFVTLCYKEAGLPDPSGLNYSPIGTTETMIRHMKKTSTPQPGDVAFFGSSETSTAHVNIVVGGGESISMGGPGDPRRGPSKELGPAGFLGYWTAT